MAAVGDLDHREPKTTTAEESRQTPEAVNSPHLKLGKKHSSKKLRHSDSLDIEAGKVSCHDTKVVNWCVILQLAFQSIGVVYGDIGTSPLYVYSSTFSNGIIKHPDDILGVLSLILYTLTLIPLAKYVFIVLRATDNGQGESSDSKTGKLLFN
ncbi:hypothetical protein SLEP1_g17021 [Rubroshorea leprosula]|uniref:K+ potassium transporter integral membrane domain-containing protein n=1 Tax=Rubroshorea leprosula TaxID=152421 RepID=A0AAV5J220_9ROSI|nr:hypothetical protein SLEP1_g17021 [Rubroshorea leprosula]